MFDGQLGRLISLLKDRGVYNNTVIFYTADNGPHQGEERSDIHWSTNFLRQCKASNFEGGLRVPGIMHSPAHIKTHRNVTTPTVTMDILPTIMDLLNVESDHPDWEMDGMSLLPYIGDKTDLPRPDPIGISWGQQKVVGYLAIIDNDWKLLTTKYNTTTTGGLQGQCEFQPPYSTMKNIDPYLMFNLAEDYHELYDQKTLQPAKFKHMMQQLADFKASLTKSQMTETGCGKKKEDWKEKK